MAKNPIPSIQAFHLEAICKSIADSNNGLTGSEIGHILAQCQIVDTDPTLTKWKRLYNAFVNWQNHNSCSNYILNFLRHALQPSRYIGKEEQFQARRHDINKCLSFIGVEISDRGTLLKTDTATTLLEAQQRASHYKYKLENRNVHLEVFKYCNSELIVQNYFHSIFEAVKSIADRLRAMTGLYADGNALAETAFSTVKPLIQINFLKDDTDRNEHIGLMNMIKSLFGLIRNPTAHKPKIKFVIEEDEALDIMTIVSFVHKKLDKTV
jgi:uncharacterized protein (TIGR02391 family)